MPAVAITGGSGFIGRRLIERLGRDDISAKALMRHPHRPSDTRNDHLRIVRGSLQDDAAIRELVDDVDAVVHLAGLIKAKNRRAFFDVNEGGVRHLADRIEASPKPPKLVLVSSLAAREPTLSSYAASKRAGEEVLSTLKESVPWTILRPPAVYGPGDRETLAFFKGVKRRFGAKLGREHARFSLLYVDDLVDLILAVIAPQIAHKQTLEPDDGKNGGHSWCGMIAAAEKALGVQSIRLHPPKALLMALGYANVGLRLLPGYTPMLTPEKVREITHLNWVSNSRSISSMTDWKPKTPVDRGFPATIDWYQLHSLL
ncbi:MAG: NAD(P)-dependent oxidoreductase [Pseudomonadota bacterium]